MKYKTIFLTILITCVNAFAAEINLRSGAIRCESTIVTLGDVAEITFSPQESVNTAVQNEFRNTILFPAPNVGEKRIVSQTQIRDVLAQLGISSVQHRIYGATEITLLGQESKQKEYNIALTQKQLKEIEANVIDAIEFQLNRIAKVTDEYTVQKKSVWNIALKLTPEQTKILAASGKIINVSGGHEPWVGKQRFQLELEGIDAKTSKRIRLDIEADVNLPPDVAVFVRSVSRGKIVSPSDVTLMKINDIKGNDYFTKLEDVIGKEVRGNIREGAVVNSTMIAMPILVEKRRPVTVHVKTQGITIKDVGLCVQDGSLGDIVMIERINSKKETFMAKVVSHGTVEAFVGSNIVAR